MVNLANRTLVLLASSGSSSNFSPWMYERIGAIQVLLESTCKACISIIKPSFWVYYFDEAIQATSSTSEFSSFGTWMNLISSKWPVIWMANLWYFCICSFFASYSWFTFPTMSLELLLITKLLTPRALASLKLVSIASYSALLFVVGY